MKHVRANACFIFHFYAAIILFTLFLSLALLLTAKHVFVYQELRKDWLSILMVVTSARSSINIRHLEKATVSTGKEGLLSEGNSAYNWSRFLLFTLESVTQISVNCMIFLNYEVIFSYVVTFTLYLPNEHVVWMVSLALILFTSV